MCFSVLYSGADDLGSIVLYCLVKSGLKNVVSESHMMEDFMMSSMERNQDGYSVATFCACAAAVQELVI